jgi:hypothetical protein
MRQAFLLTSLGLFCFLSSSIVRQSSAQPLNRDSAARPQSSEGTVYYCASSWDQNVVYFSAPFQTDELARTAIQDAYTQFLKQKYSYANGASSVVCSISRTVASAQSDKSDDEASVKRANHTVTETGWTYRGANSGAPATSASASAGRPATTSARTPAPASRPAASSVAANTAPAPHPAAPANPAPASPPDSVVEAHTVSATPPASIPVQSPGGSGAGPGYYTLCRFQGQRDGHPIMYVTPIIHTTSAASTITQDFYTYMTKSYDLSKVQYGSGYCRQVSASADQQAYTMSSLEKQWAASKTEVTRIDWTDTPSEVAAINAKVAPPVAPAASPASASPSQPGLPFISCSSSGGAGIDTYYTGVFQTAHPVRRLPNGGFLVDQSVLDRFYAYLTQKGYKFKPGSNYGCDVKPTEAEAKAAQHKRAYEGGACSTCGKVVETGWKDE